jgi:hypothetical protein
MTIFVLALGAITLAAGLAFWSFQLLEYSRQQTEKNIAIFYRDKPMECTMFLNRISLEETKKEINNTKHKLEHGF